MLYRRIQQDTRVDHAQKICRALRARNTNYFLPFSFLCLDPPLSMDITLSGDRPITAISGFSLHLLPHSGNSAIMFGGFTVPEEGKRAQYSNDTYKLTMTNNTVVSSVNYYYNCDDHKMSCPQ